MKKDTSNLKLASIKKPLTAGFNKLRHYFLLLFVLFVLGIYGLMAWHINSLLSAQPSQEQVTEQVEANNIQKVDPAVVKQLQTLRDNSVNVQVLFDQGRSNPFQ
jgi:flagellar basal body-associated protein FliL